MTHSTHARTRTCTRVRLLVGAAIVALTSTLTVALPAAAQEITLRAANAFQEGTYYARNFERFVKKVNEEGKGLVQINYVGGPKAIPTFELANALRGGVVDLANTTTSFTTSIVPEGLAFNYTHLTMAEMRKNGTLDYLNRIFMEKGLYYYARTGEGIQYYIYTNRKIDKADLTGFKMRIAPIYRDFFQKLGAQVVQIAPGEVYTALERGVVDGYGWPLIGIFDLGWHERTKYRVEPGFYAIELGVIFNANTWKRLNAQQRQFLEKQAVVARGPQCRHGRQGRPGRAEAPAGRQHPGDQAGRRAGKAAGEDGQRRRVGCHRRVQPRARREAPGDDGAEVRAGTHRP